MSPHGAAAILTAPPSEGALLKEVLAGLKAHPKRLHPKYFYDEKGSELFDRITELPEYYLTRTEIAILKARLPAFAREFGHHARVIEPGSGSGVKTRILLDALQAPAAYVPVDISPTYLMQSAEQLEQRYPATDILPVCADFTQPFNLPAGLRPFDRTLVFFPGSTIGNLEPREAIRLLEAMGRMAGRYGKVIVGADLKKDPRIAGGGVQRLAGRDGEVQPQHPRAPQSPLRRAFRSRLLPSLRVLEPARLARRDTPGEQRRPDRAHRRAAHLHRAR